MMNKVLIVLENDENIKPLLTKASEFKPDNIGILYFGSSSPEVQLEGISKRLKLECKIDVIHVPVRTNKEKVETLKRTLEQTPSELVVLSRPLLGKDTQDLSLIKAILREDSHSRVLLCGNKPWPTPIKILATLDVLDDSSAQLNLNKKVLNEISELAGVMSIEASALSIISIPRVSQEMDVVDPYEVLSKKGKTTKAKLEALLSSSQSTIEYSTHIDAGSPSKEIPSAAKKLKTNLVVMGNVGRKGLQGLVIGNTAEKILTRLSVDALIIKS